MTLDRPAPGVVVAQPAKGFRYGSDAMWLVGFALATGERPRSALDLGTGSGVIAALLAAHGVAAVGIDSRPEWAPLWAHTLAASRTLAPLELRTADLTAGIDGRYELVVANPPYFAPGTGPVAPDPWKRAARTESTASIGDFVRAGLDALTAGGRMCLVVPREREDDVRSARGEAGIHRWVRVGRRRSLLCLARGAGEALPEELPQDHPTVSGWVDTATHPRSG